MTLDMQSRIKTLVQQTSLCARFIQNKVTVLFWAHVTEIPETDVAKLQPSNVVHSDAQQHASSHGALCCVLLP